MSRKKTREKVIEAFRKVHGDKYDYALVEYIDNKTKVKIRCKEHGEFEQSPVNHLMGKGCPDCGGNARYDNGKIVAKFRGVHGGRYDYSLVNYEGRHTKVKIICNIHGAFEQTPGSHIGGSGCPDCAGKPIYDNGKIIAKFRDTWRQV